MCKNNTLAYHLTTDRLQNFLFSNLPNLNQMKVITNFDVRKLYIFNLNSLVQTKQHVCKSNTLP